ncbi:Wzz/FepE/Etk N-terminal domain-containing protein, partial [Novosphingobium sp. PASSN1]|uniref:Wzz/FepE/Etk N-terminal domain-containing protein n=1 Tax=Novosphingobium sp. PASSN1 TaxID=2015561 RepID=UPI0025FFFD20
MQQITHTSNSAEHGLDRDPRQSSGPYGEDDSYLDGEPAFDIREIVAIVRANLLIISIIIAASLALAVVVTMLQTPRYTAETTLQINDQSAQVLGKQDDISQDPVVSAADTERFLQTQIDILKSRTLLERVAQKLRLIGNPRFYDAMGMRQPAGDLSRGEL